MKREPKELKDQIRTQLGALLSGSEEPPPWKLQALKLSIGFLAVEAKLEESEYGGFFGDGTNGDASSVPERPKPATRRRKGEPDLLGDDDSGGGPH